MLSTNATTLADYKEYAFWLITIVLIAFSFRYAKEIIAFVLENLYKNFIQNTSSGVN